MALQRLGHAEQLSTWHKTHTSKVMLKIPQARLQQYVNQGLPDVQAGFRKGKRNQKSNCQHALDHRKIKEFQKNIYFCFIDYAKAFDFVDHNKLENSLRDGNTRPPYLPLEKSVYRSRSNWERSTSRLYTITLLI